MALYKIIELIVDIFVMTNNVDMAKMAKRGYF